MEQELQTFIDEHVAKIKPLMTELYTLHWQYDITGEKSLLERKNTLEIEYVRTYADSEKFAQLKKIEQEGKIENHMLKRQLTILINAFQMHQCPDEVIKKKVELSSEINTMYNCFRGKIDGQPYNNNQIKNILHSEKDNDKRRKAWEASKQIGSEVAPKLLELVRLRNENARKNGFRDFYQMALTCKDLDEHKMFETLDRLAQLTDEPFGKFKQNLDKEQAGRFGIEPQEMRPWHYADPFFQELPLAEDVSMDHFFTDSNIEQLTRTTYNSIGFEIDDIMERSDLYPKDKKCQHAYCSMIDRDAKDVRILCNIDQSQYWVNTMLHEFGHGVYDKYIDDKLPFLLKDTPHTLSTEAIAMLMDSLSNDKEWLVRIADAPEDSVGKIADKLKEQESTGEMVFVRWGLVMVYFERDLYKDPDQDLNRLWWDYVEKFQLVTRPEGRDQPDWASKIHLALAPVYYQNYLYGLLIASQLHHHIIHHVGNGRLFHNPELAPYLIEKYFKSGALQDWNRTLEQATGERLKPDYCVKQTLNIN